MLGSSGLIIQGTPVQTRNFPAGTEETQTKPPAYGR
jgi:hypothetical protein